MKNQQYIKNDSMLRVSLAPGVALSADALQSTMKCTTVYTTIVPAAKSTAGLGTRPTRAQARLTNRLKASVFTTVSAGSQVNCSGSSKPRQ